MGATLQIPLFPLGTVLYPDGQLPLRVFEQRYLDMTKVCIRDDAPFGVCLIREGSETGAPAVPHSTGCTARIVQWEMPQLGVFHLLARGESVFRIIDQWCTHGGLLEANVELDDPPAPQPLPEQYDALAQLLRKIMHMLGPERFPAPVRLGEAAWVGHRLAEVLPLEPATRQRLLELRDPLSTLNEVRSFLQSNQVLV